MDRIKIFIFRKVKAAAIVGALTITLLPALRSFAQEGINRKVKTKIPPSYPEMARRLRISGTVKLSVVVTPNGTVKNTTVLGGHPVLVNAAMDAVKRWKFEPAADESTGTVEIKFTPENN